MNINVFLGVPCQYSHHLKSSSLHSLPFLVVDIICDCFLCAQGLNSLHKNEGELVALAPRRSYCGWCLCTIFMRTASCDSLLKSNHTSGAICKESPSCTRSSTTMYMGTLPSLAISLAHVLMHPVTQSHQVTLAVSPAAVTQLSGCPVFSHDLRHHKYIPKASRVSPCALLIHLLLWFLSHSSIIFLLISHSMHCLNLIHDTRRCHKCEPARSE